MTEPTAEIAAIEDLAERLYEWSGGIFWRGETSWQDRHREEARRWFAYAAMFDRYGYLRTAHERALHLPAQPRHCRSCQCPETPWLSPSYPTGTGDSMPPIPAVETTHRCCGHCGITKHHSGGRGGRCGRCEAIDAAKSCLPGCGTDAHVRDCVKYWEVDR